jgi:hypothetical protein
VVVGVIAPSAVSVLKVKAVTSATPRVLRPVASDQRAANVPNAVKAVAKVAAHVKTATAVDAAKVAMSKANPPSTTTRHLKLKRRHAPKHATNAWPAKSAVKAPKAATSHAKHAVNVAKAKAVANAAHAVNATKAVVNAPLA